MTAADGAGRGSAAVPDSGAVIICTRDRPRLLTRCLAHLGRQDWPPGWSVLVVDNSASRSAEAAFTGAVGLPPGSRYAWRPDPGFAAVRNAAVAEAADVRWLCFLDDDMVVPTGWLAHMVGAAREHPDTLVRSRVARVGHIPEQPGEVDLLAGTVAGGGAPAGTGGLLLPAALLPDHPFDPRYDLSGGEDVDLLLRLGRTGVASLTAPGAVALEEDRWLSARPAQVHREYVRLGRLYLQVRVWNGLPAWPLRVQGLLLVAPTLAAAAWWRLRGDRSRARQAGRSASTRMGLVLGPRASARTPAGPPTRRPPAG